MQRFEALGIDRGTFPYRLYGPEGRRKIPRYFAFKLPIAVDEQAATFVYVDPGLTTDSELRAWGAADPAGQTKTDPEIRQEIARLEQAITAGNRELLRAAGGFDTAADRLELLQQLPDGTPTKATARGAIDRFTIWPTVRLTTPEAAI